MKKSIFFILASIICSTTFSQQALWGGEEIISPEIHNNNTVTFRLNAPNAKQVEITGDFLPTNKMETPMGEIDIPGMEILTKNNDEIWEYTTPTPLRSELYSYTFIVDGLKITDPANINTVRDVASITNTFIIPGQPGYLYSVNDIKHGTISHRWYYSPTLKEQRRLTVYTPNGYESDNKNYPILYLLHGSGGDEEAWIALGRTAQILDNLISEGKAEPMIVVMPNGHTQNTASPTETNRYYKPAMGGGPREAIASMEDSFEDILNFIEKEYRVKNEKTHRAIAGLSMGGMHSAAISAKYTNTFDYIGIFSAPPIVAMMSQNSVTKEKNIEEFASKLEIQNNNGYKLYWIACGDTDFLYQSVIDSMEKMDKIGFNYTYRESEEGHIWKNWRIYLSEFVPMLFK